MTLKSAFVLKICLRVSRFHSPCWGCSQFLPGTHRVHTIPCCWSDYYPSGIISWQCNSTEGDLSWILFLRGVFLGHKNRIRYGYRPSFKLSENCDLFFYCTIGRVTLITISFWLSLLCNCGLQFGDGIKSIDRICNIVPWKADGRLRNIQDGAHAQRSNSQRLILWPRYTAFRWYQNLRVWTRTSFIIK